MIVLVTQSCPTLCNPMYCRPPGSSVHGILQARILEWVAIVFSRGIFQIQGSNLDLLLCRQILYSLSHQGSPNPLYSKEFYYIREIRFLFLRGIGEKLNTSFYRSTYIHKFGVPLV